MVLDETPLQDLYEKVLDVLRLSTHAKKNNVQYVGKLTEKKTRKKISRRYLSNNLSSRFISCDVSLLTIITYFWAIQRGLQYFYGPFL